MTDSPQQSQYPTTLQEWEVVLTHALLRADYAAINPIRSFEITPETLAQHCGLNSEHARGAEAAFRSALRADPYLHPSLQNGTARKPTDQVPNCISYLALSLLVDSLLDGAYAGKGQYREKLAQWLGINRSFTKLSGIAAMWEELVKWLDGRIAVGDRFRPLILPEPPKSWTHIGYTRYLSFPARRDIEVLRKLIEKSPSAAEDAWKLVLLLDPLVGSNSVSFGMKAAFQDFRRALRAGTAFADHRFWQLVLRAKALTGHAQFPAVSLQMEFDEDSRKHYRLTVSGSSDEEVGDIGSAATNKRLLASPNLGPPARLGIIIFRSSGLAAWTALAEPPNGVGPFHIAVADHHLRCINGTHTAFERSGSWQVTTQPVSGNTLYDILKNLGLISKMRVRSIVLADGVRVGSSWLGLPRYLPVIEGAEGDVDVSAVSNGNCELSCANGALFASSPINGEFIIGDEAGHWSRKISFLSKAEVHAQLDGASYKLPEQKEWHLLPGRAVRSGTLQPDWDETVYRHQDMLEAVYASARVGISEGALISLIDRAARSRAWDLLRTLQESTFLDGRPRVRWRGRAFTLGHPTLGEIEINGQPGVLVSGAVPSTLELDFRQTVELHGGRPFRHLPATSLAPPLLGAIGLSATALAGVLGWSVEPLPTLPCGSAANRLIETTVLGEHYILASQWDWAAARFRVGEVPNGPVSLVRLVHPGGRDHDIYRVTGSNCRSFNSRHAAIVEAYQQAGMPLFRFEEVGLGRITAEGSLPLEIARALRVRALANGGASDGGWTYFVGKRDIGWLNELLPGLIQGAPGKMVSPTLIHRRGRGTRRPLWNKGAIEA